MTKTAKPWYKSKTVMFNMLMSALVAAEANISLLEPALGGSTYGVISFTLTVGNVILRFMTNSPVQGGKQ